MFVCVCWDKCSQLSWLTHIVAQLTAKPKPVDAKNSHKIEVCHALFVSLSISLSISLACCRCLYLFYLSLCRFTISFDRFLLKHIFVLLKKATRPRARASLRGESVTLHRTRSETDLQTQLRPAPVVPVDSCHNNSRPYI